MSVGVYKKETRFVELFKGGVDDKVTLRDSAGDSCIGCGGEFGRSQNEPHSRPALFSSLGNKVAFFLLVPFFNFVFF